MCQGLRTSEFCENEFKDGFINFGIAYYGVNCGIYARVSIQRYLHTYNLTSYMDMFRWNYPCKPRRIIIRIHSDYSLSRQLLSIKNDEHIKGRCIYEEHDGYIVSYSVIPFLNAVLSRDIDEYEASFIKNIMDDYVDWFCSTKPKNGKKTMLMIMRRWPHDTNIEEIIISIAKLFSAGLNFGRPFTDFVDTDIFYDDYGHRHNKNLLLYGKNSNYSKRDSVQHEITVSFCI